MSERTTRIETYEMTHPLDLFVSDCGECGVVFAVPTEFNRRRRDDGATFYCPNGHLRVYRVTERQRAENKAAEAEERAKTLERRLTLEQSRRDQAEAQAREERERTAAARAEVARTRQRAVAGACPCCNRSFVALARHMATKHPDYLGVPELPAAITLWRLVDAVAEVVGRASEPLTPDMVHGRLVLAGRRYDTVAKVRAALYNAERTRGLARVAPSTWSAA